jgi:hypothetical protein
MGSIRSDSADQTLVTHSICRECTDNLDFQLGVTLGKYIESLKVPIIAADQSGLIIASNSLVEVITGRAPTERNNAWPDNIYECAHARLPQGCKNRVHCSGCAIRFVTAEVHQSGISQHDVPAHLNHCSSDLDEKADLLISAERIDNVVHLKIVRL